MSSKVHLNGLIAIQEYYYPYKAQNGDNQFSGYELEFDNVEKVEAFRQNFKMTLVPFIVLESNTQKNAVSIISMASSGKCYPELGSVPKRFV